MFHSHLPNVFFIPISLKAGKPNQVEPVPLHIGTDNVANPPRIGPLRDELNEEINNSEINDSTAVGMTIASNDAPNEVVTSSKSYKLNVNDYDGEIERLDASTIPDDDLIVDMVGQPLDNLGHLGKDDEQPEDLIDYLRGCLKLLPSPTTLRERYSFFLADGTD